MFGYLIFMRKINETHMFLDSQRINTKMKVQHFSMLEFNEQEQINIGTTSLSCYIFQNVT